MYAYINPSLPVYPSPQQPVYIPLAYTVHWFVVNAQGYYNNCFFKKNFLFCIGVQPVNNIMIVSGGQQRDSAIHTHVSISTQTPLPSRLPDNIEQSSLCYTVGPFWLFVLNTVMCTSPSQIPNLSLSPAFLLVTISSFSKSVGLFYK